MCVQSFKNLVQNFEVIIVCLCVDQEIINVNNNIGNIPEYSFN